MEDKKEILLTQEGYQKLEDELEILKTVRRREVADRIKVAISFGDISENAEYDEAKDEQPRIEAQITELVNTLKSVEVIDTENTLDTADLGANVKVYDYDFEEEVVYKILGSLQADPMNNIVSNESPIGKALVGSKVGETVFYNSPAGEIKLKILEITY